MKAQSPLAGPLLDHLVGIWRRLTGRAAGTSRQNERARLVWDECRLSRYNASHLRALVEQFPDQSHPLVMLAEVCAEEKNWSEMLVWSEALVRRFPAQIVGYRNKLMALRALGRNDESERLALRVMRRFPGNVAGGEAFAYCAQMRNDFVEAERRFARVRRRFPRVRHVNMNHASVLCRLGRFPEADAVAAKNLGFFHDEPSAWILFCEVAERSDDWAEAARRWLEALGRFQGLAKFHVRAASALRRAGRCTDAARLLDQAVLIFPNDPTIANEVAAGNAHIDRDACPASPGTFRGAVADPMR